ncbi:MAG: alpha-L-fucosidase [Pirellulales bacterium]|nr:alpha-L-fucosidase [Pirellulales bacterium]
MLNKIPLFVLLLSHVISMPTVAAEKTDWLRDAKWGVMTHYLGAPPSSEGGKELTAEAWNAQIDAFGVPGLVKQLVDTGTKYYLITIGQNSGHYCAPNATYDRLVGIKPSKCSHRDLVADLAKALRPHGIRLMVYLPSGAPAADPVAMKRLGWRWGFEGGWPKWGKRTNERLPEFQKKWEAIIREWSLRWGKDVAGWWIDGCYFADEMYRAADAPNFASLAAALKAGNPDAIVAFNPGVKVPVVCLTKHEDYTAGEVPLKQMPEAIRTCPGRWIERDGSRVQYQLLTYLGDSWCRGEKPQLSDATIIDYVRRLSAQGGAATFDVPIGKNGLIPQPFVDQLKAVGKAVK